MGTVAGCPGRHLLPKALLINIKNPHGEVVMVATSPSEPSQPQPVPVKDSVISANHLTKKFGDEFAVQDVSFEVPRASIFGFIGPSGSGKTTTVRLLTGVYTPTELAEFQSIDPSIIVSPFRNETKSIANVQPSTADFFALAVLALLLQHLAVTFAAFSIVRERNVGTMELFRVSPLSAAEALFGKYTSYMPFGGVIAAILSALLIFTLHVPMLGNWWISPWSLPPYCLAPWGSVLPFRSFQKPTARLCNTA